MEYLYVISMWRHWTPPLKNPAYATDDATVCFKQNRYSDFVKTTAFMLAGRLSENKPNIRKNQNLEQRRTHTLRLHHVAVAVARTFVTLYID